MSTISEHNYQIRDRNEFNARLVKLKFDESTKLELKENLLSKQKLFDVSKIREKMEKLEKQIGIFNSDNDNEDDSNDDNDDEDDVKNNSQYKELISLEIAMNCHKDVKVIEYNKLWENNIFHLLSMELNIAPTNLIRDFVKLRYGLSPKDAKQFTFFLAHSNIFDYLQKREKEKEEREKKWQNDNENNNENDNTNENDNSNDSKEKEKDNEKTKTRRNGSDDKDFDIIKYLQTFIPSWKLNDQQLSDVQALSQRDFNIRVPIEVGLRVCVSVRVCGCLCVVFLFDCARIIEYLCKDKSTFFYFFAFLD